VELSPFDLVLPPAAGICAYTAVAVLVALIDRSWSTNLLVALVEVAAAIVALVGLFAVVTWFRDDDWLAVGFLFAPTLYLGNLFARLLVGAIATGSPGEAVFEAGARP
jgi:hypothetical protein